MSDSRNHGNSEEEGEGHVDHIATVEEGELHSSDAAGMYEKKKEELGREGDVVGRDLSARLSRNPGPPKKEEEDHREEVVEVVVRN